MLRLSAASMPGAARAAGTVAPLILPGVLALAFVASAAATVLGGIAMASMGDAMSTPGRWAPSMTWVRMPGQGWPGAVAVFLLMWMPMMAAMMLPSVGRVLSRYGRALACAGNPHAGRIAAAATLGYFLVWAVAGVAIYLPGAAWAQAALQHRWLARAIPFAAAAAVMLAGVVQFTAWKVRRLACCRAVPGEPRPQEGMVAGLRQGLRLGFDCVRCCGNLMAVSLAAGVMDLRTMAIVTLAISAERLLPAGERVARAVGLLVLGAGLLLFVRAVGAG